MKRLSFVAILMAVLAISGCAAEIVADNTEEIKLVQYVDNDWGINFLYPEGWEEMRFIDPGKARSVSFTSDDMAKVAVAMEALERPTAIDEYADQFISEEETSGEIARQDVLLDDREAIEFTYRNKYAMKIILVICIDGDNVYRIYGQSDFDIFNEHLPLFKEAITSFDFMDP